MSFANLSHVIKAPPPCIAYASFIEKGKILEKVTPKVLYEGPTKLIVNEPQKE
jgi:hypothetical protein